MRHLKTVYIDPTSRTTTKNTFTKKQSSSCQLCVCSSTIIYKMPIDPQTIIKLLCCVFVAFVAFEPRQMLTWVMELAMALIVLAVR